MVDTVSVTIALPVNGTPFDRAQAIIAAMYAGSGTVGQIALGQLLGDIRIEVPTSPPQTIRFFGGNPS